MKRIISLFSVVVVFLLFSCSSSNHLILKVEEHKKLSQPLAPPLEYSTIADVGDVGYKAMLTYADGFLYVGNLDGEVYQIDPSRQRKRLVVEFNDEPIESSVAVDGGYLFVGTNKGRLYKVDIRSGKVVAKRQFGFPVLGRIYARSGKLYITLENDTLYCLNEDNLAVVWKYVHGEYNMLDIRGVSGILFGDDGLYVGFDDGSVDKVSYRGDQVWEAQVGEGSMFIDSDTTPQGSTERIYITSVNGYTEAVSKEDGSLIWKRKISTYSNLDKSIFGLYLADQEGAVCCLDESGGETIWRTRLSEQGNIYSIRVVGKVVFALSEEGKLVALDYLSGRIMDIKDLGDEFSSPMLYAHKKLFVVSRDGEIYSIFSK
ncbi:outer membrane protein assembly factor BamB family protein [Hippea sp. KM1]|uniref:outer membrane protein assembly factor BamB family protein n=1 Tax=Hippea sp. KM1 TaxID=944481 RepID=UPI00046D59A1|nr:PQQ-binding-like beta-propeller repeat protein [Hippea sp. KM1]